MKFEELQNAWKAQGGKTSVTIDADLLLREVRRNSENFDRMIFWRDVREIGAAAMVLATLVYISITEHGWALPVVALACLWVAGFLLVDRRRQRATLRTSNDSLQACIEASLDKVNHQISLLKNVVWWYLCPLAIGFASALVSYIFLFVGALRMASEDRKTGVIIVVGGGFFILAGIFGVAVWFGYRLSQANVRKHLEPRRQELETLLNSLKQ